MFHEHGGVAASLLARGYASAAMARRRWFERHAEARRRLARPVVSVGNLRAGGSGKTPVAAFLARLLRDRGERPSILSRGYGRRDLAEGVVVVSDGRRLLADLDRAGDEPLMLARALDGVSVLVCPDRHLAGRLAERRLGCTVHILDDGFQHFALERDLDLLLVAAGDLADPRTLPAGLLREPVEAARAADALLAVSADQAEAERMGAQLGVPVVFRARRVEGPVTLVESGGRQAEPAPGTRVLAVAGVAEPRRFVEGLRSRGWNVAGEIVFADHHHYTWRDLAAIARAAGEAHAVMAVTTEKDLTRLLPLRPFPIPVAAAGLEVVVEPVEMFGDWIVRRLDGCRAGREGRGGAKA